MADEMTIRAIAHVRSDFDTKFGIPRQSGVVPELEADVVFTPEFRRRCEALNGAHTSGSSGSFPAICATAGCPL